MFGILDLDLRHGVMLDKSRRVISIPKVGTVRVFDLQKISSLLNMIGTAEQSIHFLKRDLLGLGNEVPDEGSEAEVDARKEIKCIAGSMY